MYSEDMLCCFHVCVFVYVYKDDCSSVSACEYKRINAAISFALILCFHFFSSHSFPTNFTADPFLPRLLRQSAMRARAFVCACVGISARFQPHAISASCCVHEAVGRIVQQFCNQVRLFFSMDCTAELGRFCTSVTVVQERERERLFFLLFSSIMTDYNNYFEVSQRQGCMLNQLVVEAMSGERICMISLKRF
jgi:hypothetical protein